MKREMMILLSVSWMAVANDSQNRIKQLLEQNPSAIKLDWKNQNLGNQDFEGLGMVVPSITSLDLSNNSFTGEFPLTTCLTVFPNLKTLKVSDNRITGFTITTGKYRNIMLKMLCAENTDCVEIDLHIICKHLMLEKLDLSDSRHLQKFKMPDLHIENTMELHLRNVIIGENELSSYRKAGIIDSKKATGVVCGFQILGTLVGCALWIPCLGMGSQHCVTKPLPVADTSPTVSSVSNYVMSGTVLLGGSVFIGNRIGKAIAYYCLPNHGTVTAVKFITNSTDEAIV